MSADAIEADRDTLPLAVLWPGHRTRTEGRTYTSLRRAGIHDIGSLTRCTASGLLEVDGIGPGALGEVRRQLGRLGLNLRGEEMAS